jgi:hypothetical protein
MSVESERLSVQNLSNQTRSQLLPEAFGTLSSVIWGERTRGGRNKNLLWGELKNVLDLEKFASLDGNREGKDVFDRKLNEFRLRMIGALSVYLTINNLSYENLTQRESFDGFYLLWFLGAGQDDIIDDQVRIEGQDKSLVKSNLKDSIFGEGKKYYRGAIYLLEEKITNSDMGSPEKKHLRVTIADFYKNLIAQESEVITRPFSSFGFEDSKNYREIQNQNAGRAIATMLNWDQCLDPRLKANAEIIPKFSFLTQIIDDIGDTAEDYSLQRPSYSIGALIDHPQELDRFADFLNSKKPKKILPNQLKRLAPQSWDQINNKFNEYLEELNETTNGNAASLTSLVKPLHTHFLRVQSLLHKLHLDVVGF